MHSNLIRLRSVRIGGAMHPCAQCWRARIRVAAYLFFAGLLISWIIAWASAAFVEYDLPICKEPVVVWESWTSTRTWALSEWPRVSAREHRETLPTWSIARYSVDSSAIDIEEAHGIPFRCLRAEANSTKASSSGIRHGIKIGREQRVWWARKSPEDLEKERRAARTDETPLGDGEVRMIGFSVGHGTGFERTLPLMPIPLGLALDGVMWAIVLGIVYGLARSILGWWRLVHGRCPRCRYPHEGLPTSTCPECGHAVRRIRGQVQA